MKPELASKLHYGPLGQSDTDKLVLLWNEAFQPPFHLDAAVWRHCTWDTPGFVAEDGRVAWVGERPVGVVITKVWRLMPLGTMDHTRGFISALAVHPQYQRHGLGSRLLEWAEWRLREHGAVVFLPGREVHPFLCGIPEPSGALRFFERHGYTCNGLVYDTRRDLRGYTPHPQAEATRARLGDRLALRPATADDLPDLLAFLDREFPGRWRFDIGHFLDQGGAPDDIMLLRLDGALHGFAHLHSPNTPPTAYGMNWRLALTPPAGGLGPIGVSEAVRGEKLGLTLLDAGVQALAERGTRGCVIDWTTLLDFYAKVGFQPWIAYHQARKTIED